MGTSLNGQQINTTYDALLKTSDLNGLTTTRKTIGDGVGVDSCFRLATTSAEFTNTTIFNGNVDLNANVDFTNATVIGLNYATTTYVDTEVGNEESARITADGVLQGNIDTNTGNISTNTSNITILSGDVSTNTSNISDLQSGVGNVIALSGLTGSINLNSTDTDFLNISVNGNDLDFEVLAQRTILEDVKNATAGTLLKGTPLHITGSTGNEAEVIPADASTGLSAHLILNQDLTTGASGKAVAVGFINNVSISDTTNFQPGTEVYLASGGGFTHIKPTGTNIVQFLGVVIKASTTSGPGTISGLLQNMGVENQLPNLPHNYIWLGDTNGVPQATDFTTFTGSTGGVSSLNTLTGGLTLSAGTNVSITDNGSDTITINATGTGGGISWNGSTANAVGTYGSSTTIDAEAKLLFNGSNLDILSTNSTDGVRIFGGIYGVSNPTISNTTGSLFSSVNVDTNLILTNQHKIAFDTDLTNTYIAADLSNPENLEIHADANVRIWADEAFEVWEPVATPSKMFSIAPDGTGTQPRVTIGNNTNTDFWLDTGGLTRVRGLHYLDNVTSAGRSEGQIIFKGSTTGMTNGYIYVFDGSNWSLASVSNCTGLLGVAVGSDSAVDGMMINGIAGAPTGTYTSGAALYISDTTPGLLSTTAPTGTGEIVRRVGYGLGGITYTFTPSMEYITLA